jgi:hypothetical protein
MTNKALFCHFGQSEKSGKIWDGKIFRFHRASFRHRRSERPYGGAVKITEFGGANGVHPGDQSFNRLGET